MFLIVFIFLVGLIIINIILKAIAPNTQNHFSDRDNDLMNSLRTASAEQYEQERRGEEFIQRQTELQSPTLRKAPSLERQSMTSTLNELAQQRGSNGNAQTNKPRYTIQNSIGSQSAASQTSKPRFDHYDMAPDEKPRIAHSSDDCTGGSIHDGYHEGTARNTMQASQREGVSGKQGRSMSKSAASAQTQGVPMPGENHSVRYQPEATIKTQPSSTGADKLVAFIGKKPSIVQGVIWGEILGKPKGEQT